MLLVCFDNLILGKLEYKQKQFVFTSNPKDEAVFKQSYPLAVVYDLFDSKNKVLDKLPAFLDNFLKCAENPFYQQKAHIQQNFDDFQKLTAMSKLNFDKKNFYLKTVQR